jgi:hypothetical protein
MSNDFDSLLARVVEYCGGPNAEPYMEDLLWGLVAARDTESINRAAEELLKMSLEKELERVNTLLKETVNRALEAEHKVNRVMTPFTYRVYAYGDPSKVYVCGSSRMHGNTFDSVVRQVMKQCDVVVEPDKVGFEPPLYQFVRNGVRVSISVSPVADNFVGG